MRSTLRLLDERKIKDLFPANPPGGALEASGVLAREGKFFVVFDNRTDVARLSDRIVPDRMNGLFGMARGRRGFEGITYNPHVRRYYLLIESRKTKGGQYRPEIFEYDDSLTYITHRKMDFIFSSENKGFEAIIYVTSYQLGNLTGENRCPPNSHPRLIWKRRRSVLPDCPNIAGPSPQKVTRTRV